MFGIQVAHQYDLIFLRNSGNQNLQIYSRRVANKTPYEGKKISRISPYEKNEDIAMADEEKCLGCGLCAIGCPEEVITMVEIREPSFIPELGDMKYA